MLSCWLNDMDSYFMKRMQTLYWQGSELLNVFGCHDRMHSAAIAVGLHPAPALFGTAGDLPKGMITSPDQMKDRDVPAVFSSQGQNP